MIELELPWPPKELSPNARVHWAKRGKVAKAYRAACHLLAKKAGLLAPAGRALLMLEFVPPDRRRRDDDNMLASFKAGRDGLAEALGIDDSRFVTQLRVSQETATGGVVRVRISKFEEGEEG
ncbi:RusA family crossover junction endodeoxyribonuclease [Azotobacter salinestris]|uniref:endodeoxyribonuclease RusA n=1 Tax=Azotobacter salinestris TaxID=69964 RepID=UPI001266BF69|nr:endodeoxyribonuclease RusA [Azotobacter salinestris]